MKKIVIWALAILLIFTEILFPIQMHAEETTSQCEAMAFKVEAPIAGDEKLIGEGQSGQEIELLINNLKEVITIDDDGDFEYEWKDEVPEADEIITLKNGPYEIELIVTEEAVETQPIEAELTGVCEEDTIIQDEEPPEDEIQEEEQIDKADEESSEMEEEMTEESPAEEELENEEGTDTDEEQPEPVTEELEEEKVDTAEEPSSEEAVEEELETPIEAVEEEDFETIEPESEENPDEEIIDELESEEESQPEETEEALLEESIPADEDSNEVESIEEKSEEIERGEESRPEENWDQGKLEDEGSEGAREDIDVTDKQMKENETTEVIKEDGEILKGSFFSLLNTEAAASGQSEVPIAPITRETVRVSTPNQFNNALSSRNVERIILEADIRQPNPSVVQSSTGRKIIDADGNNIDLVNSTMVLSNSVFFNANITEMVIRNGNLFTTNNSDYEGFIKKENLKFTLHLENINFNVGNDGADGKLGSSWESTVKFYGTNIINTKSPYNGLSFQRVIVNQDAVLEFHHTGNSPALSFDRKWNLALEDVYGLEINENARVNISSDGPVFEADLRRLIISEREVQNTIKKGAQVVFEGEADALFILDTSTNFFIDDPMSVIFNNKASNGSIFSRIVSFNVKETLRKDWARGNMSENPSYTSGAIQQEQFDIRSNIRRMEFTQPVQALEPFEVDAIFDTHTSITGRTLPGAVIAILDEHGRNLTDTTTSDKDGTFKFEAADLNNELKAGTKFKFKANLGNAYAEAELAVRGNRLEFSTSPPDITFKTKEIKDEVQVIDRQSPEVYTFAVKDTRKNGDWKITASADPLNDGNGNKLENSLYFFDENGEKSLMEKSAVQVASKDMMDSSDTQEVVWGANEGILLETNTIFAEADKEYAATVNWTLSNGP